MALAVGTPAPDFTLLHRVGESPIQLSAYADGQTTVILFFPLAFSGVCTDEMCRIAEDYGRWEEVDARVLDHVERGLRGLEVLADRYAIASRFSQVP